MKKEKMKQKENKPERSLYFRDAFFFWPRWRRFLYRVIFSAFLYLGLIFSFFLIILQIERWSNLAIILFLFFVYVFIKQNQAEFSYPENNLTKPNLNLAHFLFPKARDILLESRDVAINYKISLESALLLILLFQEDIEETLSFLDISSSQIEEMREYLRKEKLEQMEKITDQNYELFLENVCRQAFIESVNLKRDSINIDSLMLSLYFSEDPRVAAVFDLFHLEKSDLVTAFEMNRLSREKGIEVLKGLADKRQITFQPKRIKVNRSLTSRPTPTLDLYGIDFTELALELKIGIMIGHQQEYQSLVDILTREGKSNVLLVGPDGVGKETIVSYLALNLVHDKVPPAIRDYRLINLSLSSLLEDIEEPLEVFNRLTKITKELLFNRDIILYLPQFHNYKSLAQKGGYNALDAFQSLINTAWVPIIGATTPEDYRRYLEEDSIIRENFEIIKVKELTSEEAIAFLAFRSLELQRKTKVKVSFKAIKRAVALAQRFLTTVPLPSSAESLLTEAIEGARRNKKKIVTEQDIVDLVSLKTQIPLDISSDEEREKLLNLEELIHKRLINQEEAVQLVASALRQYRAGLSNVNKPIAVFLFVGPTGVGKTELAKALAEIYFGSEKTMIRFDMAEYQDKKSIYRFIGSPDGSSYGALTEAARNNPFSLILLDEFEKAHPDVLNIFLALFDEGRLTDNLGQIIDFTNTIIIATSNALSDFIKDEIEKGTETQKLAEILKKKLTDYFKPELLNRFNEVVVFRPLTQEHLKEIVELKLKELANSLMKNKKIELFFDEGVVEKLAQLGYNPIFGARPLDSVIRHYIKDSLAKSILQEKTGPNSKVNFVLENGEIKTKIAAA
ncbi:MAG: ATP-dependent Clp protease ATP-binding subunit [Candidatus Pacebacteria bacterium]|nr:ATP-dependent Clp protease ATP-binding subunit [Candidatus Paceibacterota bacterium]